MERNENSELSPEAGARKDASPADGTQVEWTDTKQRRWRIDLTARRIVLRSGDDVIELPAELWRRDIYAMPHGTSYIVRFDTFAASVSFLVASESVAPLLALLQREPEDKEEPEVAEEFDRAAGPLIWPKVSPLAVSALGCSVLAFVPLLGLLPASATVVLIALHRRRVRQAPAWRHSRILCAIALAFLFVGLLVSALATWCLVQPEAPMMMARFEPPLPQPAQEGLNWGVLAGGLFVVLLSLSLHEAAHAITAWWVGDGLAKSLGRVTLNPLAHIDPIGTIFLPIILAVSGGPIFGYARPVPVRVESLPRHRRAHILISLAGPGSNLLLAAASLMFLLTVGCMVRLTVPEATLENLTTLDFRYPVLASGFAIAPAVGPLCTILKLSFIINTVLAVFNLIPIPPLDGSWVLEHSFPKHLGRLYAALRPYGFFVLVGAMYVGLFQYLMWPVVWVLAPGFDLLASATGF